MMFLFKTVTFYFFLFKLENAMKIRVSGPGEQLTKPFLGVHYCSVKKKSLRRNTPFPPSALTPIFFFEMSVL